MSSSLFITIIQQQKRILLGFRFLYAAVLILLGVGIWSLYTLHDSALFFVDLGYWFGRTAIIVYVLTLLPGIVRRLKRQSEPIALLLVFRRQLGILMYLFVFTHFWFLFAINVVKSGVPPASPPPYILMGILANYLLLALAVTSNDWATKKLGIWWNRIHSLTYTIVWIIFAHVALIRFSIWTVIIGAAAIAVLASHLYARLQRRK